MMEFKQGDRVEITKPGHPAEGRAGVALGASDCHGSPVWFVACANTRRGELAPAVDNYKAWPIYVLRPCHIELIGRPEPGTSARLVESIIESAEARGCPLRGLYDWAGPYIPKERPHGNHR